ncbi:MAG: hypothetical protein ACLUE3_02210 [Collinsella sp.]
MSSYVKRVGDLTEPVELSASQVTEKMTSTVDTGFDICKDCIHEIRDMSGSVVDVVRELKRRHGR